MAILLACSEGGDGRRATDRIASEVRGAAADASLDPGRDEPAIGSIAEQRLEVGSAGGRYRIGIRPETGAASIGALHAWVVVVSQPDGRPADVRELRFDGGMPQHGHGFETAPRVTARIGPGAFRVDGVRFSMAGEWTIRVDVVGAAGADSASFVVDVGP